MRESRSQGTHKVVSLSEVPTSQGGSDARADGLPKHRLCEHTDSVTASFADKLQRNREITTWYHDIDNQLIAYMGTPELPTWARFAKHASYSAGVQLRNMYEVLQAVDAAQDIVGAGSKLSLSSPCHSLRIISRAVLEIGDLFRHQDLMQTVLLLGAMRAGAEPKSIDDALDASSRGGASGISLYYALTQALPRMPAILGALPKIREELLLVSDVISDTNQKIYDFMAPRLRHFLERSPTNERVTDGDDPSARFLSHALGLYEQARQDSIALQNPSLCSAEVHALKSLREDKVMQANIIATFGEQLYRVEPGFVRVKDILDSLTAFMSYQIPGMNRRLASDSAQLNWGVLYERMGIDASRAPRDPHEITPEEFPDLLPSDHPSFQGTISQVLIEGTKDSGLAELLKRAPKEIEDPKVWG